MSQRELQYQFLGSVSYGEAVELQHRARDEVKVGDPERLLLLEHPHVYTLGRNAEEGDVLLAPEALAACGIELWESNRGGQVTYHGPGQLMGYPILNLSPDRRDIRRYVRDLQEVLVATLKDFGVEGEIRDGQDFIGVWADGGKIASIGVHLSRWITTHGFALNVSPDLSYFSGIVPCGLQGVRMTSIQAITGETPALALVGEVSARHLAERFDRHLVPIAEPALAR